VEESVLKRFNVKLKNDPRNLLFVEGSETAIVRNES
jgi:hypothetical protein